MESKKENFKRISEARTKKIIDLIELLGNLTNTSFYEYSDKEIDSMFNTIEEVLKNQKKKLKEANKKSKKIEL